MLFNRFYLPDFDLERLEVVPAPDAVVPHEVLVRLHWVAILYGHVKADLAVTGGVHGSAQVLKAMMAGARVAMMTSALLQYGIDLPRPRARGPRSPGMEAHEYTSIAEMQGSMSYRSVAEPAAFERANYMKVLSSYALPRRGPWGGEHAMKRTVASRDPRAAGAGLAWGQAYPTKVITIIVPFSAGGPTDTVTRLLAQAMSKTLGQQVIVENVGGAGGTIGATRAAKAAPDGYTLLLHHIGMATTPDALPQAALPLDRGLRAHRPRHRRADDAGRRKEFPAKDLKELIAYVKANKDKVSYANAGLGAASHLCGMLFMSAIDTDLTTVPYKGTGPAMNDLLGGQVDFMCDQTTNTTSQIKAGKIKVYGVTTKTRVPSLPEVPTLHEAGLPGFEVAIWHGLYAPKGTPKPVDRQARGALQEALKDSLVKTRFAELGTEPVTDERARPEPCAATSRPRSTSGGRSSRRPACTPTEAGPIRSGSPADFWSGPIFGAPGVPRRSCSVASTPWGRRRRWGPGYFPTVLGVLLALIGLALIVRAFLLRGAAITAASRCGRSSGPGGDGPVRPDCCAGRHGRRPDRSSSWSAPLRAAWFAGRAAPCSPSAAGRVQRPGVHEGPRAADPVIGRWFGG